MERVIKKDDFGDIACNDIIIYSINQFLIGKNIINSQTNWEIISTKYYQDREDDSIVEVWYRNKGIILDNGLNKRLEIGKILPRLTLDRAVEISYEQAMQFLDRKQNKELENNNKDLLSKVEDELEKENKFLNDNKFKVGEWVSVNGIERKIKGYKFYMPDLTYLYIFEDLDKETEEKELHPLLQNCFEDEKHKQMNCRSQEKKQNNNGGATDYYSLPRNANTLQDLIEHRNMNGSVKDIFKACYRLGIKTEDELRDLNKMAYYSLREIGRITGRKDYVTIAKELMGEQSIEKDENEI